MSRWTERQHELLKALGIGRFWPAEPMAKTPVIAATEAEAAVVPLSAATVPAMAAPADDATISAVSVERMAPPAAKSAAPAQAKPPAMPRPDASALEWPQLKDAVEACQECGLCEGRQQAVLGVGHTQAHWMLVGEAPGEQEDRQGEPFVGRAGQLLDRILEAQQLTREPATADKQVYIANVVKCRPPGNRNPTPEELLQCEPYLLRQVALVKPRLIVAMGRFAAHTLLQTTEPIGRLRGRVHDYHGIPLIVTYHPAYLLRNPADKGLAWDDWCLARQTVAQASALHA